MRLDVLLVSELDHKRIEVLRSQGYRILALEPGAFSQGGCTVDGFFMAKRINAEEESDPPHWARGEAVAELRMRASIECKEPRDMIVCSPK